MSKKILIIDDDNNEVATLSDILEEHGYKDVVTAMNGQDGMRKASEDKPDLIIMDVMMPGMDGVDSYVALKNDPSTKHIPLIILTGKKDMEENFRKLDIHDFIIKPFDPEDLITTITNSLSITPSVGNQQRGAYKIFLAGFSKSAVAQIEEHLNERAMTVQSALNGKNAIAEIQQFNPDLILLEAILEDVQPSMVIKKLRKLADFKQIPIIVFSYFNKEELGNVPVAQRKIDIENGLTNCLNAGANECIGEFDKNLLLKSISEYIPNSEK